MKNLKLLLKIYLLIGSFYACTEQIDMQLNSTSKKLIVEGELSNEPRVHSVKLSCSTDYYNSQSEEVVSGALVRISDEKDTIQLNESATKKGTYLTSSDYHGVPGHTYHLTISKVDLNHDGNIRSYEATSKLNPVATLDWISLEYEKSDDYYRIFMYGQDPKDTKDYYAFRVYLNNKLVTDTISEITLTDDRFFNGEKIEGLNVQNLYQGKKDEVIKNGDMITLEMMGITQDGYNYIRDVKSSINKSTPLFGGPPATVAGNISNGAIGFFLTYSSSKASLIFDKANALYDGYYTP